MQWWCELVVNRSKIEDNPGEWAINIMGRLREVVQIGDIVVVVTGEKKLPHAAYIGAQAGFLRRVADLVRPRAALTSPSRDLARTPHHGSPRERARRALCERARPCALTRRVGACGAQVTSREASLILMADTPRLK